MAQKDGRQTASITLFILSVLNAEKEIRPVVGERISDTSKSVINSLSRIRTMGRGPMDLKLSTVFMDDKVSADRVQERNVIRCLWHKQKNFQANLADLANILQIISRPFCIRKTAPERTHVVFNVLFLVQTFLYNSLRDFFPNVF